MAVAVESQPATGNGHTSSSARLSSLSMPGYSFPSDFMCPLSGEVMREPVILSSGQSFERVFADRWLAEGHETCPKTGVTLVHTCLTPNDALKNLISEWCKSHMISLPPLQNDSAHLQVRDAPPPSPSPSSGFSSHARNSPFRRPPTAPTTSSHSVTANSGVAGSGHGSAQDTFDLSKARASVKSSRGGHGSGSSSHGVGSLVSPQSVLDRNSSFPSQQPRGTNSSSGSNSMNRCQSSAVNRAPVGGDALSFSREMAPAIPKHMRSPFPDRSSSLERTLSPNHRPPPPRMDSSPNDSPSRGADVWAAASAEDSGNDDALGKYLSAAEARRKQKRMPAAEPLSYSQQLLTQSATRRNRRMSCDSNVCEMRPLVDELTCGSGKERRNAAHAIRVALKDSTDNRLRLVAAGGVRPLVTCLSCCDVPAVEHASAALLYLALAWDSAMEVASAGGIRALVDVLKVPMAPAAGVGGSQAGTVSRSAAEEVIAANTVSASEVAKSNAAAALFALSNNEENRKVVAAAGAGPQLVRLLKEARSGRARKDACLALYGAAWCSKSVEEMVRHGVVGAAVALLGDCEEGVEDKASALLAVLAGFEAGIMAMEEEEDLLFGLVDVLEGGSIKAAEAAATALLLMARHSEELMEAVLAEGCLPALAKVAACSKSGSDSRVLLQLLRDHTRQRNSRNSSATNSPGMSPMNYSTRSFSGSLLSISMSPRRPPSVWGGGGGVGGIGGSGR